MIYIEDVIKNTFKSKKYIYIYIYIYLQDGRLVIVTDKEREVNCGKK